MKTALKILMLICFMNTFTFCTAEDLNEDDATTTNEAIFATGGDDTGEVDNDRDDG